MSQRGVGKTHFPPRYAGSNPAQPRETIRRFYTKQHRFYAGIDLHARTLHLCVLDSAGNVVYDKDLPARPETLLRALAPFREDLVLGVECMFAWYWVADLCADEHIPFIIGHALYMKLIQGAGLSVLACQRTGAAVERATDEETRRGQGAGYPGREAGASGVSPVAQAGGVRRGTLLVGPGQAGNAILSGTATEDVRVPLLCSAFRRRVMSGIDFRQARQEVRLSEVLALVGYEPKQRLGEQLRGAVSGAWVEVNNEPLLCGAPGQEHLALLPLWRGWQCPGPVGGPDETRDLRGGAGPVPAAGPHAAPQGE